MRLPIKKTARTKADKFFYTWSIKTVALNEAQDATERWGRLGIDLKTEVDTWEHEALKTFVIRGRFMEKPHKQHYSQDQATRLRDMGPVEGEGASPHESQSLG
jgi:hypothetical protein